MYKFEILVFTDVIEIQNEFFEYDITSIKESTAVFKNSEFINCDIETYLSKRVIACIPDYDKVISDVSILKK
ncbi:hypothetical protein DYQ05_00920 [Treponema pedis]|uniref:Uncharacterized protein n=1 Tax=Treponema pedis str. T A4 TaxID=1291379 RepID=S5ZRN3_9SPIR|nr:hypothetical protein TPE_0194 [Treponema pedis str. T A4]QSI03575.1 hypothetical protein DYQ05_00920 [Treponema pedis]